MNRSDIVRTTKSGEIRELMAQQLEARRMPLPPETLDDEPRRVLLEWLRDGAPAVTPRACIDDDGRSDE